MSADPGGPCGAAWICVRIWAATENAAGLAFRGVLPGAAEPNGAPPGRASRGAYCAAGAEAVPLWSFWCCSQRSRIFSWRCSIFAKRSLSAELTVVFC